MVVVVVVVVVARIRSERRAKESGRDMRCGIWDVWANGQGLFSVSELRPVEVQRTSCSSW